MKNRFLTHSLQRLPALLIVAAALFQTAVLPAVAQNRKLQVAVFKDAGVGPCFNNLMDVLTSYNDIIRTTVINGEDVRDGALRDFDLFFAPGGSGQKETASLAPSGAAEVKRFVMNGGCYVGICAGCYMASNEPDFLGLLSVGIRDRKHWFRGKATLPIEFTPAGMDVFGIKEPMSQIVYHNGPILDCRPMMGIPQLKDNLIPLAFFRGEIVGQGGEVGVMNGAPAMVLSRYGKGLVLGISPHPEQTPPLNKIIPHAIRWLVDHAQTSDLAQMSQGKSAPPATRSETSIDRPSAPAQVSLTEKRPPSTSTQPADSLSARAYGLAMDIFKKAEDVKYVHKHQPAIEQITQNNDGYLDVRTDCSGFISFIVRSVSPRHYRVVHNMQPDWSYPQAKTWARFFDSLSADQPSNGWLAVANFRNLKPGDIIAWVKPPDAPDHERDNNTGHVMMVVETPGAAQQDGTLRYVAVRVIDSSTTYHFQPEQLPPNAHQEHRDGLGIGYIRVYLSPEDQPIGYWAGTYWGGGQESVTAPKFSKVVRFGRLIPNMEADPDIEADSR